MNAKLFRLPFTLLISIISAVGLFFYFFFRINPELIYQAQQPVFFFDRLFWDEFRLQPGGAILWLSRLAAQLYYNRFLGSLLLALLLTLIPFLFHQTLKIIVNDRPSPNEVFPFAWLPLPILILLYSRYDFGLTAALGALITLTVTFILFRFAPKNLVWRLVTFTALFAVLYWMTGGPAFLFAGLTALAWSTSRPPAAATSLVTALFLAWLGMQTIWLIRPQEAFTANLNFQTSLPFKLDVWFWICFLIVAAFYRLLSRKKTAQGKSVKTSRTLSLAVQSSVVLLALAAALAAPIDAAQKKLLRLDYHARRGQWRQVLETVQDGGLINTYIGQFQANRALFHLGKLCSDMFTFEQRAGIDGLFLHESLRAAYPLSFSDLYFDLGYINEAQHWAHESLSVFGETPWNLQRLAEVYLLKGETAAARKCLERLMRTVWHRRWAKQLLPLLERPQEKWPDYLRLAKQNMPTTDFLFIPGEPEECLEHLLADRPNNRAAYEYALAAAMLLGKVGKLMNLTDRIEDFDYRAVPRHVEEAMLLFISNVGQKDHKLPAYGLSPATLPNYRQFLAVLEKYKGDKNAALPELRRFSDTYWFYAMYRLKKQ
ncbi:MAG: DUF6057 family protein [candidate division KSB1 bacterium]|nr:DUF6057 family protein [candidate division KSB1 bacterium]